MINHDSHDQHDPIDAEIVDESTAPAQGSELALPSLPNTLYLLPVTERPFFPAQGVPVLMNDEPWMDTVKAIGATEHHMVGLVMADKIDADLATPADFAAIGTVVRMHHPVRNSGKLQFIAEGLRRVRIVEWLSDKPPFLARVDYPDDVLGNEDELRAYAIAIINTLKELVPLNPLYSEELKFFLNRFNPNEPSTLTDFAASLTTAPGRDLQAVLETFPVLERMKLVLILIRKELEVAKLQTQIREKVEEKMSEQQRKFFLREQLKAIQQELGIA
ncbi:MAG: LON peptidase substrate-binding domain-containing protein, partial [Gammaproteobacteria bacterium]|nr:LON peptidase substrate-binding domain-containing protein [Gammaproteobacteria bacterium]